MVTPGRWTPSRTGGREGRAGGGDDPCRRRSGGLLGPPAGEAGRRWGIRVAILFAALLAVAGRALGQGTCYDPNINAYGDGYCDGMAYSGVCSEQGSNWCEVCCKSCRQIANRCYNSPPPPPPTPPDLPPEPGCTSTQFQCMQWASEGHCGTNKNFMCTQCCADCRDRGECMPPPPPPPPPSEAEACTWDELKGLVNGTTWMGPVSTITVKCHMRNLDRSQGSLQFGNTPGYGDLRNLEIIGACGDSGTEPCVLEGKVSLSNTYDRATDTLGLRFMNLSYKTLRTDSVSGITVHIRNLHFRKGEGITTGSNMDTGYRQSIAGVYFWSCRFENNQSRNDYATMYVVVHTVFVDCQFNNNKVVAGDSRSSGNCGAMGVAATVHIQNTQFSGNRVTTGSECRSDIGCYGGNHDMCLFMCYGHGIVKFYGTNSLDGRNWDKGDVSIPNDIWCQVRDQVTFQSNPHYIAPPSPPPLPSPPPPPTPPPNPPPKPPPSLLVLHTTLCSGTPRTWAMALWCLAGAWVDE